MSDKSYAREIIVSASPTTAYIALTEGIDQWWTETSNTLKKEGDTVTFRFEPTFWSLKNYLDTGKGLPGLIDE